MIQSVERSLHLAEAWPRVLRTLAAFAQNDMPLDSCEDRVVRLDRLGNWE